MKSIKRVTNTMNEILSTLSVMLTSVIMEIITFPFSAIIPQTKLFLKFNYFRINNVDESS